MTRKERPGVPADDQPWSPPSPSVATRRPSARSRYAARVTVISPDLREVLAESDTEAKAAYALLADQEVASIEEQPPPVSYVDDDGEIRVHTLDFIAILKDGVRVAVLVKPEALAERRKSRELVERLARQVPNRVADRFVLLTEEDVGGDRAHDAKLINAARLHPRPEHDATVLRQAADAGGPTSIAALMAASRLGGAGFRAVARLIASGELRKLDPGRISPATRVALGRVDP